ncbi:hypothetical protein ONZ45_g13196 [Pleurotus djamor]|nr:hypothetical protein ONZ45_g13196 [Pleurotus djamor]
MRTFLRFVSVAVPLLLLGAAPTGLAFDTKTGNVLTTHGHKNSTSVEALHQGPESRQVHQPDYGSSSPPDHTSTNTTSPAASRDTISRRDHDLEHGTHLVSRSKGRFQVKQLRRRNGQEDHRSRVSQPKVYSAAVEPHGDEHVKYANTDKRESPSESRVYAARPLSTPYHTSHQGVSPGRNPPAAHNYLGEPPKIAHREFMEDRSNISSNYPNTRFQETSESIRDADD